MPVLSFKRPAELTDAVIEAIAAGNSLARYLLMPEDGALNCVCGRTSPNGTDHNKFCPVARWYAAVEAMRKAVRP